VVDRLLASLEPAECERILDNGTTLFEIELPAVGTFVPDPDRMRASGVPLTVAVGAVNRGTWFDAAAAWLAKGNGADRVELPGGRVGFVNHPEQFVELLARLAGPNRPHGHPGRALYEEGP
jgi:hypothetical protein